MDRATRTAALTATAVAVPVVVVLAFVFGPSGGDGGGGSAGPSATPAPTVVTSSVPDLDQATAAICDPLVAAMPVDLDGLPPVRVSPGGPSILAWGPPVVVLQCGVARPAQLRDDVDYNPTTIGNTPQTSVVWTAAADAQAQDPTSATGRVTWTTVDRSVYLQVVVDKGDVGYLTTISGVVAAQLPPVCQGGPQPGDPAGTTYCGSRP